MKKITLLSPILLAGFILIILTSCKKDESTVIPLNVPNQLDEKPTLEQLQKNLTGKWNVVSNPSSGAKEISTFISFEFITADNKYIFSMKDNDKYSTYFGTYSINSTLDTLILPELGVIAIDTINAANFNFSLKQNDETNFKSIFTTFEEPTIPSSLTTDLLCKKMWTINWQHTNVPDSDTTFFDDRNWITSMKVYFSRNGTYFSHTEIVGGTNTNTIKAWGWEDESETVIWSGIDKNNIENTVIITKLTDTELNYKFKSSKDSIYASASR